MSVNQPPLVGDPFENSSREALPFFLSSCKTLSTVKFVLEKDAAFPLGYATPALLNPAKTSEYLSIPA